MSKRERKKIAINDFISNKKLEKIQNLITKGVDNYEAYDRIEVMLEDDFKVKGVGTNRLVLLSKNKKYNDLIFKVAADAHGIEANFREFYNGDLAKCLTFSYSISENGIFVVQERVKPFMSKNDMDKHKKEVREMLSSLEDKILLVDCKISNFANFGIRENGKVCLLDHGDTVPLPDYQGNSVINCDEESYVSLRCKKYKTLIKDAGRKGDDGKNLKSCNGKLVYSKNYDNLICEKCGAIMPVHDAYKEFMGDIRLKKDSDKGYNLHSESIYSDGWSDHIRQTCLDSMSQVNINKEKEEENEEMSEKIINSQSCRQISGYWIPVELPAAYNIMLVSVKTGREKPDTLLKALGKNPDDYKVRIEEHTIKTISTDAGIDLEDELDACANYIYDKTLSEIKKNRGDIIITYAELENKFKLDFSTSKTVMAVWYKIKPKLRQIKGVITVRYEKTENLYKVIVLENSSTVPENNRSSVQEPGRNNSRTLWYAQDEEVSSVNKKEAESAEDRYTKPTKQSEPNRLFKFPAPSEVNSVAANGSTLFQAGKKTSLSDVNDEDDSDADDDSYPEVHANPVMKHGRISYDDNNYDEDDSDVDDITIDLDDDEEDEDLDDQISDKEVLYIDGLKGIKYDGYFIPMVYIAIYDGKKLPKTAAEIFEDNDVHLMANEKYRLERNKDTDIFISSLKALLNDTTRIHTDDENELDTFELKIGHIINLVNKHPLYCDMISRKLVDGQNRYTINTPNFTIICGFIKTISGIVDVKSDNNKVTITAHQAVKNKVELKKKDTDFDIDDFLNNFKVVTSPRREYVTAISNLIVEPDLGEFNAAAVLVDTLEDVIRRRGTEYEIPYKKAIKVVLMNELTNYYSVGKDGKIFISDIDMTKICKLISALCDDIFMENINTTQGWDINDIDVSLNNVNETFDVTIKYQNDPDDDDEIEASEDELSDSPVEKEGVNNTLSSEDDAIYELVRISIPGKRIFALHSTRRPTNDEIDMMSKVFYKYDIRYGDETSHAIEKFVSVNYFGSIFTDRELLTAEKDYLDVYKIEVVEGVSAIRLGKMSNIDKVIESFNNYKAIFRNALGEIEELIVHKPASKNPTADFNNVLDELEDPIIHEPSTDNLTTESVELEESFDDDIGVCDGMNDLHDVPKSTSDNISIDESLDIDVVSEATMDVFTKAIKAHIIRDTGEVEVVKMMFNYEEIKELINLFSLYPNIPFMPASPQKDNMSEWFKPKWFVDLEEERQRHRIPLDPIIYKDIHGNPLTGDRPDYLNYPVTTCTCTSKRGDTSDVNTANLSKLADAACND